MPTRQLTIGKAEEAQLLSLIGEGVANSIELSYRRSAQDRRLPSPGQHARTMRILYEFDNEGLIVGHTALDNVRNKIYFQLALTGKGARRLYRYTHRFWLISSFWEECKAMAAGAIAPSSQQQD
jgi:hypothetical protein